MPAQKKRPRATRKAAKSPTSRGTKLPAAYEVARKLAHEFPGMEDSTSYRTPSLKVKGKFLARLREDNETLAIRTTFLERDFLLSSDPGVYFITEHYRNYPAILIRLEKIKPDDLRDRLEFAWRHVAPKSLVASFDRTRK